jgi:predicted nucleic acid-binding Zn ribbon protein
MSECKYCGKYFEPISIQQSYCSIECRMIVNRERAKVNQKKYREGTRTEKNCACCGNPFVVTTHSRIYCSEECYKSMKAILRKKDKPKRKKKENVTSLRDMAKEAREHGMTYGQYVAKMGMQKGVSS